jgi:hypothetical protein
MAKHKKQISKTTLWNTIVSPYIRNRDLDWRGYGKCISCNKVITYHTCHAGHFVRKSKGEWFYWNPDNIHAQCPQCNCYGSNEEGAIYYKNLCTKLGKSKADHLLKMKDRKPIEPRNLNQIKEYYIKLTHDLPGNNL